MGNQSSNPDNFRPTDRRQTLVSSFAISGLALICASNPASRPDRVGTLLPTSTTASTGCTHIDKLDILLDELNIIDWYDGIVIATGRRQKKAYLIVLVAWDMERSRKAFLLLDIEPSVEAEIKRSLEVDRWDEFQKVFNDVVMHYKRDVFLTFEEPANGKTLSLIQITTNELQSLRNHDVENTLTSDSLRLWFGKV